MRITISVAKLYSLPNARSLTLKLKFSQENPLSIVPIYHRSKERRRSRRCCEGGRNSNSPSANPLRWATGWYEANFCIQWCGKLQGAWPLKRDPPTCTAGLSGPTDLSCEQNRTSAKTK